MSKPLLEKILNRVKREGLEIDQSSFGKFEFDGVTWENIAITTQKVKEWNKLQARLKFQAWMYIIFLVLIKYSRKLI